MQNQATEESNQRIKQNPKAIIEKDEIEDRWNDSTRSEQCSNYTPTDDGGVSNEENYNDSKEHKQNKKDQEEQKITKTRLNRKRKIIESEESSHFCDLLRDFFNVRIGWKKMWFMQSAKQDFIEPYIKNYEERVKYLEHIEHSSEAKDKPIKKLNKNNLVQDNIKAFLSLIKHYIENKKI